MKSAGADRAIQRLQNCAFLFRPELLQDENDGLKIAVHSAENLMITRLFRKRNSARQKKYGLGDVGGMIANSL